jgi:hypothetical protein
MLLSWLLPMLLLKVRLWASLFRASGCCCTPGLFGALQVRLLLRLWLLVMPRQPRLRLRPLLAFSFEFSLRRERVAASPAFGLRLPASETRKLEPILSQ